MLVVAFEQVKIWKYFDVANVEPVIKVIMEFQQQETLFYLWNLYFVAGMCQGVSIQAKRQSV